MQPYVVTIDAGVPQYAVETGQNGLPNFAQGQDFIFEYAVPADAKQGARGTVSIGSRTSAPYPNYATLSTRSGDFSNPARMVSQTIAFRVGPARNKPGEAPELSCSPGQSIFLNLTLRNPSTGKGGGSAPHDVVVEFRRPQ